MEKLLEQILSKLNSLDETQKQLQTQVNNIQNQVSNIQSEVNSIKNDQKLLHDDIVEIKTVQKEHSELLYSLKDQLNELDAKNATNHTLTIEKIDSLSNDLDFLTHKETLTEKEVYTIKKKLEIIK